MLCYVDHSCANSGHYQPQWAHVISRLSCGNSAQRCVAQCRTATDLSRHTQGVNLFLCVQFARPKDIHFQTKHVYSNYCSVQKSLTGARGSKTARAALRIWHTLVIHPILQTRTHMPKCIEWCSVIMPCFTISVNTLTSAWNMCITSLCTFCCKFLHYGHVNVQMTNKLTWISAWNICCSMKEREMSFWLYCQRGQVLVSVP